MTADAVLVVVVPLLAAPLVALLPQGRWAGLAGFATAGVTAIFALRLLAETLGGAVVTHHFGGWPPPIGIAYRVDGLSAVMLTLVSLAATLVAWFQPTAIADEIRPADRSRFTAAFLLALAGLNGMAATGDLFNVFVFLEIASLASYILIAMGARRDRRALTASFDYLVLGAVGATFFVIGIAFLYMVTGTLNMTDMALRLNGAGPRAIEVGGAFLFIGLGLKVAIVPLHRWLPNAYAYAPSPVSTFLAMTATKVALYLMLRLATGVFGGNRIGAIDLALVLPAVGVAALLFGSVAAVAERDLKRLLAYSSVANIGLMLIALGLGGPDGIAAAVANLINHAVIKGGLFVAAAAIVQRFGHARFEVLSGLARTMPAAFAMLVLGGLALIGVPLTAGFISKLAVLEVAFARGQIVLATAILLSALLTAVYVWRIVEAGLLGAPPKAAPAAAAIHPMFLPPLLVLGAGILWLGLDSRWSLGLGLAAARGLGAAP